MNFLIPLYTSVTDDRTGFYIERFVRELRIGDIDAFMERQIDDRGYLIPCTADGRTLVKVGVSFDATERNIGA